MTKRLTRRRLNHRALWYADGVHFQCTQCGDCCTGPGPPEAVVYVSRRECQRLADHLKLDLPTFLARHTLPEGKRRILQWQDNHCTFYVPATKSCGVHPARPHQCASFPFWPAHLESRRAWNALQTICEGVHQGPLIPASEITLRLADPRVQSLFAEWQKR